MSNHPSLEALGWGEYFEFSQSYNPECCLARVAAVDRGRYLLLDAQGSFTAKLSGRLSYHMQQANDLPCVGDWVCLQEPRSESAVIQGVLDRRTELCRKVAGRKSSSQMIAANVDHVIVVQSCHYDFNLKRLERYLVMVEEGGAEAQILLSKTDLVDVQELERQQTLIRSAGITAALTTLSNVTHEGVTAFRDTLQMSHTYCFVGSSGVGKSTLINHLSGRDTQDTAAVSATGEGTHTTVRRELIQLAGGALVIDNPGMREFGILEAQQGMAASYADISELAEQCRYRDCKHRDEPGCAVLDALQSGDLLPEHYDNYLKLKGEADFLQLSELEKRRKDRSFSKFRKQAGRHLRR